MDSQLSIGNLITIGDMKFHDIEGGFGKDKRAMSVKDIAEIHGRDLKDINRLINNNRKRFEDGIDIIDLKVGDLESLSFEIGYSKQAV